MFECSGVCISRNEPFEELAADPWTLPHDGLPHQPLAPPDGGELLPSRAEQRRGGQETGQSIKAAEEGVDGRE